MGDIKEITTVEDGELKVKTTLVSGTRVAARELDKKKYITTLVQTDDGEELAVKVIDLGGGGGGGYVLPTATANRLGGIKVGENLTVEADGTLNAQAGGGGTATVSWFDNQSGTTLSTGLTIPSSARVQVYKNGKLLQAGQAITAKLFTGGSGKSLSLAQTAPISTANSWLFETELLWDNSTSGSTPCVLCYTGTTDCKAPVIIYEVKMGWYLSSNGSNWDIDTANNSSMNLPDSGYKYKFRAEFTGSSYILSYKKGVAEWAVARELNSTSKLFCDVPFMLLNSAANPSRCYNGSTLNMAKTKFIIDGQTWFDGATAVLGTDYTNDGCTMTEEASSTNDYVLDTTTGVITFSDALNSDDIAVEVITAESGTGGTSDYTNLTNKPSINSVTLTGNKTASDLGLLGVEGGTLTDSLTLAYDISDPTWDKMTLMPEGIQVQSVAPNISLDTTEEESQPVDYASVSMFQAVDIGTKRDYTGTSVDDAYEYDNYRAQISTAPQFGTTKLELLTDTTTKPELYRTFFQNNTQVSENVAWLDTTGKLPSDSMTRVVELTTTSVELASDNIYNGAELASVTFTLPATIPANFTAQLNFTSGATATTFTAPATVTFEGNDCSNGVFTPLASKRYSVMVYSDGVNVIGLVMGN